MERGTLTPRAMVVALACVLLLSVPGLAFAASPLDGNAAVLLAFGQRYTTDAGESTHSGIDLAGAAGEAVRAPAAGGVTFAGRIPAGTGSTVLACTLELADGSKVTLMPLECVSVRAGEQVGAGEHVGTLAATGDRSSSATHVHVSLRKGGLYVDPATLIAAGAAVPEAPAAPEHAIAPVPAPIPVSAAPAPAPAVPAPAAAGAPAAVGVAPPAVVPAAMAGGVSLAPAAGASVRNQVPAGSSTAPSARNAPAPPRVGVAAARPAVVDDAASEAAARTGWQRRSALPRTPRRAAVPLWSWAALAGAGFSAILLLCARSRRPRLEALLSDVRPVKDHVAAAVDRC